MSQLFHPIEEETTPGYYAQNFLRVRTGQVASDLKPSNILVGIEDKGVIEEMVEDERSDPAPTKQVGDRLIYLSRNFGELRGVPREPKISDFGLAVPSPGPHYHPIQPDLFQAPEVILCAGWSFPADIWNLGVMIWDLLERQTLFQAIDPADGEYRAELHLQEMVALLGSPPPELLRRGRATSEYFSPKGLLLATHISTRRNLSLADTITVMDGEDKRKFLKFVGRMLTWLPEDRATAKDLLSDPWLKF
ncbi:hypothetical protein B0A52_03105 [Exophiala mesophila]|uniref:Protein kinase domain-containing protein n=1 Tax=Exophiala mesophila TaxID=212818 RepID=A0A438NCR7_EXOME|nr:hypothetical protein B0A52_03105 [Exophiala mesophila]